MPWSAVVPKWKQNFFLQKYKKFLSLRLERSILKCGEKIFCRDTRNYFKFEAGKFHFETLGELFLKKYRKLLDFGLKSSFSKCGENCVFEKCKNFFQDGLFFVFWAFCLAKFMNHFFSFMFYFISFYYFFNVLFYKNWPKVKMQSLKEFFQFI